MTRLEHRPTRTHRTLARLVPALLVGCAFQAGACCMEYGVDGYTSTATTTTSRGTVTTTESAPARQTCVSAGHCTHDSDNQISVCETDPAHVYVNGTCAPRFAPRSIADYAGQWTIDSPAADGTGQGQVDPTGVSSTSNPNQSYTLIAGDATYADDHFTVETYYRTSNGQASAFSNTVRLVDQHILVVDCAQPGRNAISQVVGSVGEDGLYIDQLVAPDCTLVGHGFAMLPTPDYHFQVHVDDISTPNGPCFGGLDVMVSKSNHS